MSENSIIGEIIKDVYPDSKTGAFFDLLLIALVVFFVSKYMLTQEALQTTDTTEKTVFIGTVIYVSASLVAGLKYVWRRSIGGGGCFGSLMRFIFLLPIGMFYVPFMVTFAIQKLIGKPAPDL